MHHGRDQTCEGTTECCSLLRHALGRLLSGQLKVAAAVRYCALSNFARICAWLAAIDDTRQECCWPTFGRLELGPPDMTV